MSTRALPPPDTSRVKSVLSSRFSMDSETTPTRGAAESAPSVKLVEIARNPLNTRDLERDPEKIREIAESMRTTGQLQACAAVTRHAFLRIFPEYEPDIGTARIVQVSGGRRLKAAETIGLLTLKVDVMDDLAESRQTFIRATATENLDRDDLDAIEEAHAVQLLATECGSGKDAAEQLNRTPAWVTQRLNLLKLAPEVQAELRSGGLPLRDVRDWHKDSHLGQVAKLAEWQRARQAREVAESDPANTPAAVGATTPTAGGASRQRPSPAAAAIRRLGGTPPKIAEALRSQLTAGDLKLLVELLTQEG